MKKYFIIIITFFFVQNNYGQNNDHLNYENAVDYVTCVCINDAMPEGNKIDCDEVKFHKNTIKDSKTIALYNELQGLKNNSNIDFESSFFSEDIFSNKDNYPELYNFAQKRKGDKIEDIKESIQQFIKNNEISIVESDNIDPLNNEVNRGTNLEETIAVNSNNLENTKTSNFNISNMIQYALMFIILLLLVTLYYVLNSKIKDVDDKIKTRIDKRKAEIETISNGYNPNISNLNFNNESKFKLLESKIVELERKLNNIQIQPMVVEKKSPVVEFEIPKASPTVAIIFYMATPEDGNFDLRSKSDAPRPTQTLYKFTIDKSDNLKASFIFDSDEVGISEAVNSPHRYLEPVCEPQNAHNHNAKKITTLTPGQAEKRNEKWVVTTKAKIKYE